MTPLLRSICAATLLLGSWAAVAPAQYGTQKSPADEQRPRQRSKADKAKLEEWVKRLHDPRPGMRLAAVRWLGDSGDPKAIGHLVEGSRDQDVRIAIRAVEYLGRLRASSAAEGLVERLFVKSTSEPMKHHILVALGRIGDSRMNRKILQFVEVSDSQKLRAAAVFAIGDAGDSSDVEALRALAAQESDENMKKVIEDAIVRISGRRTVPAPVLSDPLLRSLDP